MVLEEFNKELEKEGTTKDQVQTDVELRLRRNGVQVRDDTAAFLYVVVIAQRNHDLWAFSIHLGLQQPVLLERDRSILTFGETWTQNAVQTMGTLRTAAVRASVDDLVDQFINDYLAVNPPAR